jgi:proteasome lid subunit RPN8/RPN11
MGLAITSEDLEQISRHCEDQYPLEGCGILIGCRDGEYKTVLDLLLTDNDYQEGMRNRRYTIPPEQLLQGELRAEERDLKVIGYFHSHPDHPARPSVHDFELAWPEYSYLILSIENGATAELRSWRLRPDRTGFDEEEIQRIPESADHEGRNQELESNQNRLIDERTRMTTIDQTYRHSLRPLKRWATVLNSCNDVDIQHADVVTRWLVISRACVFTMTFTSALIGLLLAAESGSLNPWLALLALL